MSKSKPPVTQAVRALKKHNVNFESYLYRYEEHGGTALFARTFDVDEYLVIKTLVMEDENKRPLIILMHGDKEVSTKELARAIGAKSVSSCSPETAQKHTGYQVGGTSPFGTLKELPVYVEATVLDLPEIYINGGKRGFIVSMSTGDLVSILKPTKVRVAV